VARKLREKGFDARALLGGYNAWRSQYPVEPKSTPDMAVAKADGG
jgi:rhodanese-related sulfurtransferase